MGILMTQRWILALSQQVIAVALMNKCHNLMIRMLEQYKELIELADK